MRRAVRQRMRGAPEAEGSCPRDGVLPTHPLSDCILTHFASSFVLPSDFLHFEIHSTCSVWDLTRGSILPRIWYGLRTNLVQINKARNFLPPVCPPFPAKNGVIKQTPIISFANATINHRLRFFLLCLSPSHGRQFNGEQKEKALNPIWTTQ